MKMSHLRRPPSSFANKQISSHPVGEKLITSWAPGCRKACKKRKKFQGWQDGCVGDGIADNPNKGKESLNFL